MYILENYSCILPRLSSFTKSSPKDFFFLERPPSIVELGRGVTASVKAFSPSFFFFLQEENNRNIRNNKKILFKHRDLPSNPQSIRVVTGAKTKATGDSKLDESSGNIGLRFST